MEGKKEGMKEGRNERKTGRQIEGYEGGKGKVKNPSDFQVKRKERKKRRPKEIK